MPGKVTTPLCLHMDRPDREKAGLWSATESTKVDNSVFVCLDCLPWTVS